MATTPTYINQRINNLQAQLNALQPYPPPEIQTLSDVLIEGNNAGSNDIDMNNQNITNVTNLNGIDGFSFGDGGGDSIAGNSLTGFQVYSDATDSLTTLGVLNSRYDNYATGGFISIDATGSPVIRVADAVSELDTTISTQSIQVRLDNDHKLDLTTGSISILNDTLSSSFSSQNLEMVNTAFGSYDNRGIQLDALTDPLYPKIFARNESGYRATLEAVQLALYNEGSGATYVFQANGTDLLISSGNSTDRMLLNSGTAESYWGDFSVGSNANIALNIGGANRCDIDVRSDGVFSAGDIFGLGANTKIVLNDNTSSIALQTVGAIEVDSGSGLTTIGDVNGSTNGTNLYVDDVSERIQLTAGTGVKIQSGTIIVPCNLRTGNVTLDDRDTYSQTFNGTNLVATLPIVDGNNVGTQYLITNTNATALSVATQSGQLIYSSTGTAVNPTKSLSVGHSQIFTAIYTTSGSTFGWSMV
jgi:hypothetical protein